MAASSRRRSPRTRCRRRCSRATPSSSRPAERAKPWYIEPWYGWPNWLIVNGSLSIDPAAAQVAPDRRQVGVVVAAAEVRAGRTVQQDVEADDLERRDEVVLAALPRSRQGRVVGFAAVTLEGIAPRRSAAARMQEWKRIRSRQQPPSPATGRPWRHRARGCSGAASPPDRNAAFRATTRSGRKARAARATACRGSPDA